MNVTSHRAEAPVMPTASKTCTSLSIVISLIYIAGLISGYTRDSQQLRIKKLAISNC